MCLWVYSLNHLCICSVVPHSKGGKDQRYQIGETSKSEMSIFVFQELRPSSSVLRTCDHWPLPMGSASYLTSYLILFVSSLLDMHSWLGLSILSLAAFLFYSRRITAEEEILRQTFGEKWDSFVSSTRWKLLPYVYWWNFDSMKELSPGQQSHASISSIDPVGEMCWMTALDEGYLDKGERHLSTFHSWATWLFKRPDKGKQGFSQRLMIYDASCEWRLSHASPCGRRSETSREKEMRWWFNFWHTSHTSHTNHPVDSQMMRRAFVAFLASSFTRRSGPTANLTRIRMAEEKE